MEKGYQQDANSLSYRKWELQSPSANSGGQIVNDVITSGVMGPSPNGILHPIRTNLGFRMISVGQDPMLSCFIPTEEQSISLTTAVAKASDMASKLTSAVFSLAKSWWSNSSNSTGSSLQQTSQDEVEKKQPEPQKPVALHAKWIFADIRQITSITLEPLGRFAVMCDTFGRISLFDLKNNVITRIWKGYRDPQISFVQAQSSTNQIPITDMYLVIYTGRRGILEIWQMKNGNRVAVADVGMGCKIYNTHNHALGDTTNKMKPIRSYLLTRDTQLKEIVLQSTFEQDEEDDDEEQKNEKSNMNNTKNEEFGGSEYEQESD